jgi:hypothetical protein
MITIKAMQMAERAGYQDGLASGQFPEDPPAPYTKVLLNWVYYSAYLRGIQVGRIMCAFSLTITKPPSISACAEKSETSRTSK